jgi:hypothetical protein
MIAKTFKGGKTSTGARATIEYLLNDRVSQGTSKLLFGDTDITLKLISQAEKKQKWSWSSGVLSFEELIKDRDTLDNIINDFEKTFFAGLEKEQYNILWVLHEDKGRTELHYIAPRIELTTGLSYNPYFVKRDFTKKDLFQEYINLKYNFSSFRNSREIVPRPPKWRETAKKKDIRKEFDNALIPLIESGIISSRQELIYQLEEWGFELNRTGKDYISVVDENGRKHRLKGLIYGESFTSWGEIEKKIERERVATSNGTSKDFEKIRTELNRIIGQQAHSNRERYSKKMGSGDIENIKNNSRTLQKNNSNRTERRVKKDTKNDNNSLPYCHYRWFDNKLVVGNTIFRNKTDNRFGERNSDISRWNAVFTNQQNTKLENFKGQIDDTAGAETLRRIRAIRKSKERGVREFEKTFDETRAGTIRDCIATTETRASKRSEYRKFGKWLGGKFEEIREPIRKRLGKKVMNELEKFKVYINLAEFATIFGYVRDRKKSSKNAPVMRHNSNGDKIVISKAKDGHYIYFNPNNRDDSGTIIDFIQNRTKYNLGQVRKKLREWLRNPRPKENIDIKVSDNNSMKIVNSWNSLQEFHIDTQEHMGIKSEIINRFIQGGRVKTDRNGNLYFMLSDTNGICGFEKRTVDRKKYIEEGSKKGLFTFGNLEDAKNIIIFESPMDLMAYLELGKDVSPEKSFYVCTMGSLGAVGKESLRAIRDYIQSPKVAYKSIIVGFDNDEGGRKIYNDVQKIFYDNSIFWDKPRDGKDWKEVLEKSKEIKTVSQNVEIVYRNDDDVSRDIKPTPTPFGR